MSRIILVGRVNFWLDDDAAAAAAAASVSDGTSVVQLNQGIWVEQEGSGSKSCFVDYQENPQWVLQV